MTRREGRLEPGSASLGPILPLGPASPRADPLARVGLLDDLDEVLREDARVDRRGLERGVAEERKGVPRKARRGPWRARPHPGAPHLGERQRAESINVGLGVPPPEKRVVKRKPHRSPVAVLQRANSTLPAPARRCASPRERTGRKYIRRTASRTTLRLQARVQSRPCYLPLDGGTILLIGPRWAMALVGTPRGHSLGAGSPRRVQGTMGDMDALPRTLLGA
jgi:hypothetical protein